jgi:hypothetical protein
MSRIAPYRSKPSESFTAIREQLNNTTLFLVNRNGPTVFSLKDENNVTYKITLGNPHSCSCSTLSKNRYLYLYISYISFFSYHNSLS